MKRLEDIARMRLVAQRLAENPMEKPVDVVRWLGAVQAQEQSIARWSVGQRTAHPDLAEVDRALASGEIVRTHALRPTWHYVAADDLRWIMAATAHRVHQLNAYVYRLIEMDEALLKKSRAAMEKALTRHGHLTRGELTEHLASARIQAEGLRLAYIFMRAELDLVICSGAPRGKQHTYALVDERVPRRSPIDRDEALAELANRFFRSHGPATIKDFTWWSSLTVAEAKRAVAAAELEGVVAHDRTWYAGDETPASRRRGRVAHLVQGYDEIVVAYSDTKDVYGRAAGAAAGRNPFLHAVVVDGRVVGHWRSTVRGKRFIVETRLRAKPDARSLRALEVAVGRCGAFFGKEAVLELQRPAS